MQIISSFIIHNIRGLLRALKGAVQTQADAIESIEVDGKMHKHTQTQRLSATHLSVCLVAIDSCDLETEAAHLNPPATNLLFL